MLESFVSILWIILLPILFFLSILFSFKLKLIQITHIPHFKNSFKSSNRGGLSSFQAFSMSLAGKIGVGSITGVYLAIEIGGYGAVFWIWISAIIFSVLGYMEGVLSQAYKEKVNGAFTSGAYYYIKNGLKMKRLSVLYAILILICYSFCFTSIQAKTIAISFNNTFNVNFLVIGFLLAIVTTFSIFKGRSQVAKLSEKIVPFMALSYIAIGLITIIFNFELIFPIIKKIIYDGTNFKSFFAGTLTSILIGIRRGIFSSEAGVGTSAILSGSVDCEHPVNQGFVQTLTIYITSLIICTISAFSILIGQIKYTLLPPESLFKYFYGDFGGYFLSICIFLFAFSTILSAYYFGESVLIFLKANKFLIFILKIFIILILILSTVINNNIIWNISDLFIGILTSINIYAMFRLSDKVLYLTNNYKNKF